MEPPMGTALANDQVVLEGVDPRLLNYVEQLGLAHRLLFGKNMVITSGKDGKHVQNSFHERGLAVDVRTIDKDAESQLLFLAIVAYSAPSSQIAFFDERAGSDEKHVHLEYHGA